MRALDLPGSYDAVVCLYSVIGYVRDLEGLRATVEGFAKHDHLGLFTQAEMESAFRDAGLTVERRPGVLRRRGVYLGSRASR